MKKVMLVGCLVVAMVGCAQGGGMYRFPELGAGERYVIQRDRAETVLEPSPMHHKSDRRRTERTREYPEWMK